MLQVWRLPRILPVGIRGYASISHYDLRQSLKAYAPSPVQQKSPEDHWKAMDELVSTTPPANTFSGRSVPVSAVGGLPAAYNKLSALMSRNHVRRELRAVARHEKASEKRNRLKRVRWRRVFSDAVRRKVQLVQAIRARDV